VTAQLVQTAQGPRIILQGLQGVQLEQAQLVAIQQQVKQQLLKQQGLARQQGKVPPTKVTIQLTGHLKRTEEAASTPSTPLTSQAAPLPSPSLLGQQASPTKARAASTLTTLPESVIKQGHYVMKEGKKVLVLPQAALQAHQATLATGQPSTPSLPSTPQADAFQLSPDYIQQTIKDALKGGNLTPELQEKLMSQLDGDPTLPESLTKSRRGREGEGEEEWRPLALARGKARGRLEADTSDTEEEAEEAREPVREAGRARRPGGEDRRRQGVRNRLSSMLFKHKEQLKKEIARKRAQLEKELTAEISAEVASLKQQAALKLSSQAGRSKRRVEGLPALAATSPNRKKRRSQGPLSPSSDCDSMIPGIRRDKLYCVCKQRYDSTKFYVGCDICSNWFHGACVNITPKMSKKMSEYVCEECRSAKENDEIYCLCRQPYDESQFYIGCERCSDWFHGRCVGILQAEAAGIDEYVCPKCDPHSAQNYPNLKKLSRADHELVRKTFRTIKANRNSQHFMEPVDQNINPKYYDIVKEPMDLSIIERKVASSTYNCLAEFTGDVTRIVENTRYFNPQGTKVAAAAEVLEQLLARQIPAVRERVAAQAT